MTNNDIYIRGAAYAPEGAVARDIILEESVVKLPDSDLGELTGKRQIIFRDSAIITPLSWEKFALLHTPYLVIEGCGLDLPEVVEADEDQTAQTGCIKVENYIRHYMKPPRVVLDKVSVWRTHLRDFSLDDTIVYECIIDSSTKNADFKNSLIRKLEFRKEVSLRRLVILGPPPIDFDLGDNEYISAEKVVLATKFAEVKGQRVSWGGIDIYAERHVEIRPLPEI